MQAELFKIIECPLGLLAIMPRPRAGDWLEDEIASWKQQGIQSIVSLLEESEIDELDLKDEPRICELAGLQFQHYPIPDRSVPESLTTLTAIVTNIVAELRENRGVGIHCRIGVGRSAALAVCVLVALGIPIESAWDMVRKARGLSVPDTAEQRDYISVWASRSLNSGHFK